MVYLLYQLQEVIFYDGKTKRTNPNTKIQILFIHRSIPSKNGEVLIVTLRRKPNRFEQKMLG